MQIHRTRSYWLAFSRALFYRLRTVFHFRKPATDYFEYIPLLVQEKPILLFSWKCSYSFWISLKPIKRTYYQLSGSYIVRLSEDCDEIIVTIRSFWRRTRFKLKLVLVPATPAIRKMLERDPFVRLSIYNVKPSVPKTVFERKDFNYKLSSFNIKSTIPHFYIHTDKINIYQ